MLTPWCMLLLPRPEQPRPVMLRELRLPYGHRAHHAAVVVVLERGDLARFPPEVAADGDAELAGESYISPAGDFPSSRSSCS